MKYRKGKSMKELIELIRLDLTSLYEKDIMANAKNLNNSLGYNFISENFIPMYFTGNYESSTVFVMLNPGSQTNKDYSFAKTEKHKYTSLEDFISKYFEKHINYGKIHFNDLDNFDLKQAAFLLPFKDSGIEIPDFSKDLKNRDLKLKAKESVLMNKLQLELIPYHSSKFVGIINNQINANNNIDIFIPHIDRLFNAITEYKRKYVIFGAKQFYYLFQAYNNRFPDSVKFIENKNYKIEGLKNSVNLSLIEINYNNKIINGLIPHSFPRRDLPNAYEKMKLYGELCFKEYCKSFKC
jgi:hypothetical protein